MELSSHVVTNLDQWVENGLINAQQREAIAQLMENAVQDAYWAGQDSMNGNYDDGFDSGWDEGYNAAKSELEEKMRDEWFQQGWEEALIEHGIEE
jgi:flagellar biosynthesis/type III secretory pathway protein FliH